MVFLNLEGHSIATRDDVDRMHNVLDVYYRPLPAGFSVVVNYDNFRLDDRLAERYYGMIRSLHERYNYTITRYTTSAFLRTKLGEGLIAAAWRRMYSRQKPRRKRSSTPTEGEALQLSRVAVLGMNRKFANAVDQLEQANAALRAEIAQRKLVETELRATEERHRVFAEIVPVVLFEIDSSGAVTYVSPSWGRVTGRPLEDVLGHGWHRFVHPEDRDRMMAIWAETVGSGEPHSASYRYRTVKGQYRWVFFCVAPLQDEDGTVRRWFGSTTDIDHIVRAEQALRETETRFRATFENAAVGITNIAPDGRYLRVNDKFCAITGYPREELLAKTFADLTHPDDVEPGLVAIRRLLAGEVATSAREKRFIRKDGTTVWVRVTVSLARTANGEPDYLIGIAEEIGERKRAEEALRDSEERLRLALAAGKMGIWQFDLRTGRATIDPIEAGLLGLGQAHQEFTNESSSPARSS